MKIKKINYHKEYKKGLPNFSNMTASMDIEVELSEGEEANHREIWEIINKELNIEVNDIDPDWIRKIESEKYKKTAR